MTGKAWRVGFQLVSQEPVLKLVTFSQIMAKRVCGEHRRGDEMGGETDSGQNQNQAEYNS